MPLNASLSVLDQYGSVEPAGVSGPVREAQVKYGKGLFIEETTTNLVTNPSMELNATGWACVNGATTRDTTVAWIGSASLKYVATSASNGGPHNDSSRPAVTVATVYTYSAYIYSPIAVTLQPHIEWKDSGGAVLSTTDGTSTAIPANKWTRLTVTGTAPASSAFAVGTVYGVMTAGQIFWLDAAQFEAKPFATSYCDGSLATPWNASGAIKTYDFEDGTVGSWITGSGTLASSTAQFYSGTRSILATVSSTTTLNVLGPTGLNANVVTAGKVYAASLWVRPSAARQIRADFAWYTSAGAFLTNSFGTSVTATANTWQRVAVVANAPATAAYAAVQFTSTDATSGDTFYVDAARLDEGAGSASYKWNGAEHNSSSTRVGATLQHTIPSFTPTKFTVCGWIRMGASMLATSRFPTPIMLGTTNDGIQVFVQSTGQFVVNKNNGGANTNVGNGVTLAAAGDLVFFATTFDGTNLTMSISKNGAALTTTTNNSAPGTPAAITNVYVGNGSGTGHPTNAAVESLLVFNDALTATELNNMAQASSEKAYHDDPRIVYASVCGTTRGTLKANTSAGTGLYRTRTTVSAEVTAVSGTGSNPDEVGATYRASVPAGSGIGQGQIVRLGTDILNRTWAVTRVSAPGGMYDEVYIA